MVQQRGNSNYWQIYTVGGRPNIISCIVAVQVQDKVYDDDDRNNHNIRDPPKADVGVVYGLTGGCMVLF